MFFNPLSANPTKWSNTLKQFAGNLPTNCLSVFDHFVKLALKGLRCELRQSKNSKYYLIQISSSHYLPFYQNHERIRTSFHNRKMFVTSYINTWPIDSVLVIRSNAYNDISYFEVCAFNKNTKTKLY